MKKKGLTMIYEGEGKGKTTAVMGSAVRAAGTGMQVMIIQFIKGEWPSGEADFFEAYQKMHKKYKSKKKLGSIELFQGGKGFVKILGDKKPINVHKTAAKKTLALARKAMKSKKYDLLVLDEAISAIEEKLLTVSELVTLVKAKPVDLHLALTGHYTPKQLVPLADLISRVDMVKHPYYKGILAQPGIDY